MSWLPQEKQRLLISCPFDEILYGGAAGGGKSSALLMDAMNHIVKADLEGKRSSAVLFRKTYKELDEIIKQSHECFEGMGWKFSKDNYRWSTAEGSNLTFSYLSNYQDALSHRGFEYDWCVARGSMIVMADGSRKPVELVCVGDMVMTMFGPCRVSVTPPSRVKRVWRVRTGDSDSLISEDHKILTTGGWESPLSLLSKLYRGSSSTDGFAIGSYLKTWQHPWLRQEVTPQVLSPHLQTWAGIDLQGNAVWSVDGRSAYAGYCGSGQDISQLQGLSVQLVLHAPSAHQSQEMLQYAALSRGDDREQIGLELGGFPNDCPIGYHFDGEQPHCQGEVYQAYTQPQVYAVGNNEWRCGWDGQEKTQEHAHFEGRISLNHPYTNKRQDSSEDALLCQAWLDPAGEAEVFDLRICGASHYLLHSGIISQNCGFDELTLWPTNEEYEYLKSRLRHTVRNRSMTPIRPRVVCTTNPGGAGHDWVKKYWDVGSNPSGMKPIKEEIRLEDGRTVTKTRIFIPSRLRDNYYLYSTGQYEAELRSKPENVRKMLLDGRWDVVEGAFFTEWDPNVHVIRPFNPPADWHRVMGADWGTRSPYCFLWGAMNPNGEIFIYRELYGEGNHETAAEVAPKIRRFEQMADEDIRERWLDSSCFDKQGNEESIADVFGRLGLHFEPSKKQNKKFSIDRLRDYLKVVNGKTAIHFMESCPNLIRTLPTLQVDRSNFDQFDTSGEDHAVDSLCYLIRRGMRSDDENARSHRAKMLNQARMARFGQYGAQ